MDIVFCSFCSFVCLFVLVYVSHVEMNLMYPFEVCSVFFLLPRVLLDWDLKRVFQECSSVLKV